MLYSSTHYFIANSLFYCQLIVLLQIPNFFYIYQPIYLAHSFTCADSLTNANWLTFANSFTNVNSFTFS